MKSQICLLRYVSHILLRKHDNPQNCKFPLPMGCFQESGYSSALCVCVTDSNNVEIRRTIILKSEREKEEES